MLAFILPCVQLKVKCVILPVNSYKMAKGSLISYMSNLVKENGGINLAQGIPGFEPPAALIDNLKNLAGQNYHQYAQGEGNSWLRELIAGHYSGFSSFTPDDFLITQGATEAIALVFIYLNKLLGDNLHVLGFEPAYESYRHLPGIFTRPFTSFPLGEQGDIDFKKLEKTIVGKKISLIFIASPGNPLGKAFSEQEIKQITQLAEKHRCYILFDAVYKDLYFNQPPYLPLQTQNDHLFYVNSFSKMLSVTGWRIGYLSASKSHLDNIRSIHDYIGLSAPTLQQQALAMYLSENEFGKDYTQYLRKGILKSYNLMHDSLSSLGFECPPIDGGYFIWAKLPALFTDGFDFAINLFESTKVAIVPGIHFSPNAKNYIRLNFALKEKIITLAMERVVTFCSQ